MSPLACRIVNTSSSVSESSSAAALRTTIGDDPGEIVEKSGQLFGNREDFWE